jgi:phage/conjugal plasmid C-4 type zinc finger TraR family protein
MDVVDHAEVLTRHAVATGIARVRSARAGHGRDSCMMCGDDIPPARRRAVPNATRCVDCQAIVEGA